MNPLKKTRYYYNESPKLLHVQFSLYEYYVVIGHQNHTQFVLIQYQENHHKLDDFVYSPHRDYFDYLLDMN